MTTGIDHLIINSPFEEPKYYWKRDELIGTFQKVEGRRPAGYVVATPGARTMDDPGKFIPIPNVDDIRKRVKAWRADGYTGVTGITKRLLEHWNNPDEREGRRFFFCQLEAIETLIWLAEAPASEHVGIEIPSDGGAFQRYCAKMATGSGKTVVMAMLIAWQALNKIADPHNAKFSKNILVIAPGLTVKRRLQVLIPSDPTNFYDEFRVVPTGLREKLYQAKVIVQNWHMLNWETAKDLAKKHSVDKRGPMSDTAYVRQVLGEMANAQNILVINDEAHHAWRIPEGMKLRGITKEEKDEATIWIGGLDRIHRTRGLLTTYDFSATPFVSIGKKGSEEALFQWIVSDFGLNDAIESGLVKTPRVVIRDDGKLSAERKSRFFHIYPYVKDDLNQKVDEKKPLPDLVKNAYALLGRDWLETAKLWEEQGFPTPPVMISVANRTETAARIKHAFDRNRFQIEELSDPENTIHIDSKVLAMAEKEEIEFEQPVETDEEQEEIEIVKPKLTKKQQAALLRETVDTVGKEGKPGEQIKNVISVGMLSEGWDAKTVTHIMGLRAFNSQLLCEQVVGRGLRRTSYDLNEEGMFDPEYVNIFGVPFTYMHHEDTGIVQPRPPSPKFAIEPVHDKREFEISWPNVLRVEHIFKPQLTLDISNVPVLTLDAYETATLAELAPVVDGKPDINRVSEIDLTELGKKYRTQRIVFETARDIYEQIETDWKDKGNKEYLLAQVIRIVENFIRSDRIVITPSLFNQGELRKRIIVTLNMSKVVQHIWEAIRMNNTESLDLVLDTDRPLRSTGDMMTWYTSRPWEYTLKSHINRCVSDSGWETSEAFELDRNQNVAAWVKNDHLGFAIYYTYQGTTYTYWPDFLVKLTSGEMLVLEVKGKDDQQNRTKREFLVEWIQAVNAHGGFGKWRCAVSRNPADLRDILTVQEPMVVSVAENNEDIVSFIELVLDVDPEEMTVEFLNSFRGALAIELEVSAENVIFLGFRPGSIGLLTAIKGKAIEIRHNIRSNLSKFKIREHLPWDRIPEELTFISYARKDRLLIEAVYYFLKLENMHPWMDVHDILPGQEWDYQILKALHSSTGFVFCLSSSSIERLEKKATLFKELETAKEKAAEFGPDGIFLIPLRFDDSAIPEIIGKKQALVWDQDKENLVNGLRVGLKQRKRIIV